jgi:hypothetical protein
MAKIILALCLISFLVFKGEAQKIIHNPDYISKNFNAIVSKIELNESATILHFLVKAPRAKWVVVPKATYIEDASGKGRKLYVVKAEGISLGEKIIIPVTDEIRYSLYFPPLSKTVRRINYGESNPGGNWYIYKLNLTRNGKIFLRIYDASKVKYSVQNYRESVIRYKVKDKKQSKQAFLVEDSKMTLLPTALPDHFFGSWYDKFGTLLFIATPDYVVLNSKLQYYLKIRETGVHKYDIETSFNFIEVLHLDANVMTLRTDRLITLKKGTPLKKIPEKIQGKWRPWNGAESITVTQEAFLIATEDTKTNRTQNYKIDYVTPSENGELLWVVLYYKGDYKIFFLRAVENGYVLYPRGREDITYKKIEN